MFGDIFTCTVVSKSNKKANTNTIRYTATNSSFLNNDHAIPKPATTVERESLTASIKIRQVKKFIATFRYQIIENLFKSKTCWQFRLSSKFLFWSLLLHHSKHKCVNPLRLRRKLHGFK